VLERAVILARDRVIRTIDLPDQLVAPTESQVLGANASLEDVERAHIQRVLHEAATLEEAAARLGIDVTTLWRKRKGYGIE
jgi:NtrC-family two-component system response regulator AlgB